MLARARLEELESSKMLSWGLRNRSRYTCAFSGIECCGAQASVKKIEAATCCSLCCLRSFLAPALADVLGQTNSNTLFGAHCRVFRQGSRPLRGFLQTHKRACCSAEALEATSGATC